MHKLILDLPKQGFMQAALHKNMDGVGGQASNHFVSIFNHVDAKNADASVSCSL